MTILPRVANSTTTRPSDVASSPTVASSSSGLSTGQKAGIGVGAAFFALSVVAVILYYFLCRRKRKRCEAVAPPPVYLKSGERQDPTQAVAPAELPTSDPKEVPYPGELPSSHEIINSYGSERTVVEPGLPVQHTGYQGKGKGKGKASDVDRILGTDDRTFLENLPRYEGTFLEKSDLCRY